MRFGLDTTALPARPTGAGVYIIQLARQLASLAEDYEIVIFAHPRGVLLLDVPESPHVHLEIIPDQNRGLRLLWEQISLPRLARRFGLDLLHSPHYTMPLALSCRSVVTFHDMTFFLYPQHHTLAKRYFFRWFIQASGRRANALIADSESTRRDAIHLAGVSPEKIHTVHLGVTDEFCPIQDERFLSQIRDKYRLPEYFLLYVGAVEPRKNLPALLRAYQSLIEESFPHHLVVVGGRGWMVDQVYRMVAESDLEERIHFIGHVPREDLPAIFNLAEVFVYPSLYEGFGIPVLEAMACATPVVTSNTSSIPEITAECALAVSPSDERALTAALRRLLQDEALRKKLAGCGPNRAANFTWDQTARRTLAVYHQVLSQQG